jgi:hypothetical protein
MRLPRSGPPAPTAATRLRSTTTGVLGWLANQQITMPVAGLAALLISASLLVASIRSTSPSADGLSSTRSPASVASPHPTVAAGEAAEPLAPAVEPSSAAPTPSPSRPPTPQSSPVPAPAVTLLNGPLSARGARPVTLRAQTAPSTTCSISVGYVPTPVLAPATADSGGAVSWTWRPVTAPPGTWPVTVACGSASATTQLVVD